MAFYALASILAVTVRILNYVLRNSCCTSDCVTCQNLSHVWASHDSCHMTHVCQKRHIYFQMSYGLPENFNE